MVRVLFVCLGNICRSPAGEGIFKKVLEDQGLQDKVFVDSAGTSAYHAGEPADGRMRAHAQNRGYELTSLSRQFTKDDFTNFDYILTMDGSNYSDIVDLDPRAEFRDKIIPFTKFCEIHEITTVPDPYYKGDDGFELVMDIIEDGCQGLLKQVQSDLK